jgi:hypothetical protein
MNTDRIAGYLAGQEHQILREESAKGLDSADCRDARPARAPARNHHQNVRYQELYAQSTDGQRNKAQGARREEDAEEEAGRPIAAIVVKATSTNFSRLKSADIVDIRIAAKAQGIEVNNPIVVPEALTSSHCHSLFASQQASLSLLVT